MAVKRKNDLKYGAGTAPPPKSKPSVRQVKDKLHRIAAGKGPAARAARNAIAARTIANAGANKPKSGITARAVEMPGSLDTPALGGPSGPKLASNEIAYGGKVYTRDNVEGLARALNSHGVSLKTWTQNNPDQVARLGVSAKDLNQFANARRLTSKAFRLARRAKHSARY